MDIATLIGFGVGLACFAFGIMGHHGPANFKLFYSMEALLIVFGGSFAAIFIAFPLQTVINAGKVLKNCFLTRPKDPYELVGSLVSMAEKARREGLLVLEEQAKQIEDPFLRTGIQLV
ncbi:MAG TPA: motility protein A, partial [bacterium]|nr:motility protein A [bacterium]